MKRPTPYTRATPATEAELAAVRAEGLTARQLRMARRVALRNCIPVTSDEEAVVLLRRKGINPFRHELSEDLVVAADAPQSGDAKDARVPVPSGKVRPALDRSAG